MGNYSDSVTQYGNLDFVQLGILQENVNTCYKYRN